jgi:hypothetical protein
MTCSSLFQITSLISTLINYNRKLLIRFVYRSEKTSGDFIGEKGVMGTHDMETFNFFKGTRVRCALAPRELVSICIFQGPVS